MWSRTIELAKDNPVSGIGVGNWKIVFPSYGIDGLPGNMFKKTFFVRPENDYVWTLAEIGIAGFVLYLSVFFFAIYYAIKVMIYSPEAKDKLLSILLFFGLVGYMVFSGFTFPKERIFHSMFLMLMMAIVISMYHWLQPDIKVVHRRFALCYSLLCIVILILAVVVGYFRLNAEIHTKRAFAARKANNWPVAIIEIDKGYSWWATLDPMSAPLKWYRGEANFLMNNIPQALEDFESAYKSHPYHIYVLNNLATCYEMTGDHDKAIAHYNAALQMYPEFEDALINLGAAYFNAGRYEESHKTMLRCKKTNNPRLQQYLKAVEEKLNE